MIAVILNMRWADTHWCNTCINECVNVTEYSYCETESCVLVERILVIGKTNPGNWKTNPDD